MPLFFFSTDDQFDPDDGLDYADAGIACAQAEIALRAIAAESSADELSMTVWNEKGRLICCFRLTVERGFSRDGVLNPIR